MPFHMLSNQLPWNASNYGEEVKKIFLWCCFPSTGIQNFTACEYGGSIQLQWLVAIYGAFFYESVKPPFIAFCDQFQKAPRMMPEGMHLDVN